MSLFVFFFSSLCNFIFCLGFFLLIPLSLSRSSFFILLFFFFFFVFFVRFKCYAIIEWPATLNIVLTDRFPMHSRICSVLRLEYSRHYRHLSRVNSIEGYGNGCDRFVEGCNESFLSWLHRGEETFFFRRQTTSLILSFHVISIKNRELFNRKNRFQIFRLKVWQKLYQLNQR